MYSTRPKRGPIEALPVTMWYFHRTLYSTRPKRGPIEALIHVCLRSLSTSCIPRVLSVAPLKRVWRGTGGQRLPRIPRVLSVAPLKLDRAVSLPSVQSVFHAS